ncbi:MAG: helix-turn-helix domain-containing protein [Chlamydiae bacterium]|nr:helix-turn-helix domain-containing protein [Chlamydiota bacterium]
MKKSFKTSEAIIIKDLMKFSNKLQRLIRGLPIGKLIRLIRVHLGMSQKILAKHAGMQQSTISRVEQGKRDITLSALHIILNAISCDLIIIPLLRESIETIRRKQARKVAEKHVKYVKGTMALEDQKPDTRFIEELIKHEEEQLLKGSNRKLWEE